MRFTGRLWPRHPSDLIIMVLDRAGWHQRKAFSVPDNLRLFLLALYSPELNPVEHLWDELRERSFHSRVFSSLDALEKHLEIALQQIKLNCQRVRSSVARPWMANSFANPEME